MTRVRPMTLPFRHSWAMGFMAERVESMLKKTKSGDLVESLESLGYRL